MAPHVKRVKGHYRGGGAPKGSKNALGNKGGTGRPPKYVPAFVAVARHVASMGGLDYELSQACDVDVRTIRIWKQKYPDFGAACVVSIEEQVAAIKKSAYHRSVGYSHPAEKILVVNGVVERHVYTEHYAPDVAAMKYVLANIGDWKDKVEQESSGTIVVKVEGGLPTETPPEDEQAG